jgi:IclR family mhp operon transcriptional activator
LGQSASAGDLAVMTNLHRTTVKRLLETLQSEGYVRMSQSDGRYVLDVKVRNLSEGFRDEEWISAVTAPLLGKLLQEVVWPTDLCTLDGDAMVIRETTHRFSRLSFHRNMVGRRLPLLTSATGRAYLAFCPDAERRQIIDLLAKHSDDEDSHLAKDEDAMNNLIQRTRHQGYGKNFMEWKSESRIAAVALPIRGPQRLLGCLNLVYLAKAMSIKEAAERYLPAMRRVVDRIEAASAALLDLDTTSIRQPSRPH